MSRSAYSEMTDEERLAFMRAWAKDNPNRGAAKDITFLLRLLDEARNPLRNVGDFQAGYRAGIESAGKRHPHERH
jgi:hypothetical protein